MARVVFALTLAVLVSLAGATGAASWLGHVFAHQGALGAPWLELGAWRVYAPWSLWAWSGQWQSLYPRPFAAAMLMSWAGLLLGLLTLARFCKPELAIKPFGKAGWASFADVDKAGLFAAHGTVLGTFKGRTLVHDGPGHVLLIGPSRSGKGRGQVVPTLLNWRQSALVLDVKGELCDGDGRFGFVGVAGYRQTLGPVLRFAPTKQASARFNPLFEVRKGENEVRDVQNIVEILVDPSAEARGHDFWDKSAKNILVGVILHVLYAEPIERKTLAVVRHTLRDLDHAAKVMKSTFHRRNRLSGAPEVHPEIAHAAESFLAAEERVQSGVKATAESYFGLFADELVAANTGASDFCVADLMCAPKPVTLFLQPPPSDIERLMPLMRLLINQIARTLMEDQEHSQGRLKRQKLLVLLDEFPLLGRMPFFEVMMGAMAGYGMKACLVCQSLNHITRAYGRDNVILDNCQIVSVLGAADPETAKRVSDMAGESWEWRESISERRPKPIIGLPRRSYTQREERRPLLSPAQVRALDPADALIFAAGLKPLRARRLKFDADAKWTRLLKPAQIDPRPRALTCPWHGVSPLSARAPKPAPKTRALLAAPPSPQRDLFSASQSACAPEAEAAKPGAALGRRAAGKNLSKGI